MVAQGRKQVDLGATTFVYDESRYVVTSIDPPIVTRVVQASEAEPCLALMLKLEMPLVRELLAREDVAPFQPNVASSPALGGRLRAIATAGDQSHRTARAISGLRRNYARAVRVEDLAEVAGMGVSTLHHHFGTLTSMSPLQYQKQLRLQTARASRVTSAKETPPRPTVSPAAARHTSDTPETARPPSQGKRDTHPRLEAKPDRLPSIP